MPNSYKPEVKTSRDDWTGNALRFATEQEALDNVRDLMMRWFAVTDTRVVPSEDQPNYTYIDGKLEAITVTEMQ